LSADDIWHPGVEGRAPRTLPSFGPSDHRLGPIDLISETVEVLTSNPVGFVLAGAVPWFGLMGPILLSVVLGLAATLLLVSAGVLGDLAGPFMFFWFISGLFTGVALITPLQAGLFRAAWRRINDDVPLSLRSSFDDPWTRLGSVFGVSLMVAMMVFVALPFCYLPAVVISVVTQFAYPAVAVHGVAPMEAIRGSVAYAREEPLWCLAIWAVGVPMVTLMTQVVCVGGALGRPFYAVYSLIAYREAFGSGPPGAQKAVTP